jgi:hypothetical protein
MIVAIAAGVGFAKPADTPCVTELRVTRQVEGWKEQKRSFVKFDKQKLFELINGGAPEYIDNGLQEGIFQRLDGPGDAAAEIYAEDFARPANAQKMLAFKTQQTLSERLPLEGQDSSSVYCFRVIGGYQVYAAFDRFYIELNLTGASSQQEAVKTIGAILRWTRLNAVDG